VLGLGSLGLVDAIEATGGPRRVLWGGFSRHSGYESLQTCLLLTLSAKTKSDGLGGAEISAVHGQSTAIVTFSPGANAALGLCMLSEDEAEHDVQAAHGKEEKRGDKREFANVVGEDRCPDESLEDPEGSETKLRTEDGEKAVKEGHRPRDLR